MVLAFVFGFGEASQAQGGEVMAVFGGAEGLGFESGHDVAPESGIGGRLRGRLADGFLIGCSGTAHPDGVDVPVPGSGLRPAGRRRLNG